MNLLSSGTSNLLANSPILLLISSVNDLWQLSKLSLKASAIATIFTFCLLDKACIAAPVPLPPQPTTAILMVSSEPEKKLARDNKGAAKIPPARRLVPFTKSLRELFPENSLFIMVIFNL